MVESMENLKGKTYEFCEDKILVMDLSGGRVVSRQK